MVKTKVYPCRNSFEARITDREFGVIRKVFKKESDAAKFCDQQRKILEERRERRSQGLSEISFTPMRVREAIKKHVEGYLDEKNPEDKSKSHNRTLFTTLDEFLYRKKVVFCHEISLDDMEELQAELKQRMSGSSVNRYFASFGGFFSRCKKKKYIRENPLQYLEKLEVNQKRRSTWTQDEVSLVESKLIGWHKDFFKFLFLTGCRPVEAANLTHDKICLKSMVVTFTTRKGNKTNSREFPLTPESAAIIRFYSSQGKKWIFTNNKGGKVVPDIFAKALRTAKKSACVSKNLVPYGLRHTFVSDLVKNNVNTMKVQGLAGHKRAQTTLNYVSLANSDMRSTVTDLADFRKTKIS